MRPSMTSFTVHVRVRSSLPASTGSVIDASTITLRAFSGTREMKWVYTCMSSHHHHNNMVIPCTCIMTVSLYVVVSAIAIHVNFCPCKSSVTRSMVYCNSIRFPASLMTNCDDWLLHSIEFTAILVIQLIVAADWPTIRGVSRPVIVIPEI